MARRDSNGSNDSMKIEAHVKLGQNDSTVVPDYILYR